MDEIVVKDLEKHIGHLEELSKWLNDIYYRPDFVTIFNQPVISMMSTGTDYLTENLRLLKQKYLLRQK
ncbi:unnamed protein product [marine sediment metagenome]|uniref:Uncharacterized protein n=1 Tax=marine sediment metagenome TaxID=412755 RepID=X1G8A9_9ZZZZ